MILKSIIVDDFFENPYQVREDIIRQPMRDEKGPDGVVYPGIVLPEIGLIDEVNEKLSGIMCKQIRESLTFARHSLKDMTPPHWAHTDKSMGDYTALIYMNEAPAHIDDGTYLVKHKKNGFYLHPEDSKTQKFIMNESNKKGSWDITDHFKAKFNRCVILDSRYIHADGPSYGRHRGDSRLVLTTFFRL